MKKISCLLSLTVLVILLLSGCGNVFRPAIEGGGSTEGKGYVRLQFSAGRTILPENLSFAAYKLTFTPAEPVNGRVTAIFRSLSSVYELEVGAWTLSVQVYSDAGATTLAAQTASPIEVNVSSGTTPVEVPLVFESPISGSGTLSWAITNNTGINPDQTEIKLKRLGAAVDDYKIANTLSGNRSGIPAGYYLATVRMEKDLIIATDVYDSVVDYTPQTGIKRFVWSDILHIYPGQTTNLTHTFGANDFFNGIEEVWLFGDMIDWNFLPDFSNKAMIPETDGTFTWKGNAPDNAHFRFALTDTHSWGGGNPNMEKGAWFVPDVNGKQAVIDGSPGNAMAFVPMHIGGDAVNKAWKLGDVGSAGYYEISVDPVQYKFFVEKPDRGESVSISGDGVIQIDGISNSTKTYTASVTGKNGPVQTVTWSIETAYTGVATSINSSGLLTVDKDEIATTLTIRATSTYPGVFAEKEIEITRLTILDKATNLSLSSLGVGTWNYGAETNVVEYELQLYKGSEAQGSAVTVSKGVIPARTYDFLSAMRAAGAGVYRFTVVAKGDGEDYADSDESVPSGNQTIVKLANPGSLWWDVNTAKWAAATNASSYSVQLYKNNAASGGAQSTTSSVLLYDFGTQITSGGTGSYTFKVKAIGAPTTLYIDSDEATAYKKEHLNLTIAASAFGTIKINSIAYGNGVYVAVGKNGSVMRSTDGIAWSNIGTMQSTTFGPGTDFSGWTEKPELFSVTYGAGKFVAVGLEGTVVYSNSDGTSWTVVPNADCLRGWGNPTGDRITFYSVTYTNSAFIAVGQGTPYTWNTSGTRTMKSTLGLVWDFVDNTSIGTTNDNIDLVGIASDGTIAIAAGVGGRVTYSNAGGTTWTSITENILGDWSKANTVAYDGNGVWVIAGDSGKIVYCNVAVNGVPTTAANWQTVTNTRFTQGITSVVYGDGKFVAVGNNGQMATSPDGKEWTAIPVGTGAGQSNFASTEGIYAAAFGTKFILGGNAYSPTTSKIAYSD